MAHNQATGGTNFVVEISQNWSDFEFVDNSTACVA